MGWFDVFKKAVSAEVHEMNLSAPVTGKYIPMEEINDEVSRNFGRRMWKYTK